MMKSAPAYYVMRRNKHKQAVILWQGQRIKVDAGLETLLPVFNQIQGVATVASCIGDGNNRGYIAFTADSWARVKRIAEKLAAGFEGKPRNSENEAQIELRRDLKQCAIRWGFEDFDVVAEIVQALVTKEA
jgi:hypothetical protein